MSRTKEVSVINKLSAALGFVDTLKNENKTIIEKYEKVNLEFRQLFDRNERVLKELNLITKEKELLESTFNDFKLKANQRLSDKEQEIEDIIKRPPTTKQLELLKIRTKEEVEEANNQKFNLVDQECKKFRSLYYKTRREWDISENEYHAKTAELERNLAEKERIHDMEIGTLTNKITMLQSIAEDVSEIERLRQTQREKVELEQRVKSLDEELRQLRTEKEDLKVLLEGQERLHKRQLQDHIVAAKGFQSERERLQSRIQIMEEDNRILHRKKDDLVEENTRHKKEREALSYKIEENAHRFRIEQNELKSSMIKEQNGIKNQCEDYKNKLEQSKNELRILVEDNQELKEKLLLADRTYQEKLRLAKDEYSDKTTIIQVEVQNLEQQLSTFKQQAHEKQVKYDSLQSEYKSQIDLLKRDHQNTLIRLEEVNSAVSALTSEKEHLLVAAGNSKDKIDSLKAGLQKTADELEKCRQSLADSHDKASSIEIRSREQEQHLERLQIQLSREKEAFEHTLERQHLKNNQEKQHLSLKLEELMKDRLTFLERLETTESILQKVF